MNIRALNSSNIIFDTLSWSWLSFGASNNIHTNLNGKSEFFIHFIVTTVLFLTSWMLSSVKLIRFWNIISNKASTRSTINLMERLFSEIVFFYSAIAVWILTNLWAIIWEDIVRGWPVIEIVPNIWWLSWHWSVHFAISFT